MCDSVTGEMSHWHWRHRRPGATAVPRLRSLPCQWSPHSPLTTRWRLYCRHCTPHIIGGIIIIRMETSRHSGSQTFLILSHLHILSRFSAACLRTWHWPVMVKWLVSGSEKLSCSHTVMQSCSCSLLTLHCTRSRLLNKVSSDHYQGSMVLHWIFPPKELPSSICFHFENIYLMLARRWNFGWQECRPHTNVSLNFLTVNFQRTIYCLGLW